mmetsp:Transcript_35176/g.60796  ORF Transcript_35176/g.60796 Transcript_35176/m.60796 type:complete len:90 (+) Transcript_35176:136-405(+)
MTDAFSLRHYPTKSNQSANNNYQEFFENFLVDFDFFKQEFPVGFFLLYLQPFVFVVIIILFYVYYAREKEKVCSLRASAILLVQAVLKN